MNEVTLAAKIASKSYIKHEIHYYSFLLPIIILYIIHFIMLLLMRLENELNEP